VGARTTRKERHRPGVEKHLTQHAIDDDVPSKMTPERVQTGYAILLNEQQPLDLQRTATILAKAENLVYGDATRAVRNCTGVLAANLPAQEAEAIANELNANGVGCFVLAMADFYHPPEARLITKLELTPESFGPMDLYGRVTPVPWGSILLLSLGHIDEQRREHYTLGDTSRDDHIAIGAVGGLAGIYSVGYGVRRSQQDLPRTEAKEAAKHVLDVFACAPNEGHWRIEHTGFSYACLGPNLRPRAEENFGTLVGEIVRAATSCYGNDGLNAFLEKAPEKSYTYSGIHQFDEENLWLLQKVYLNLRAQ